jgi:hypothetical protein
MSKDKKLEEKNPITEEIQSLAKQYNDCIAKKQQYHDLAQKCLGAIEALQKIEEGEECQDSDEKVKKD